MVKVILYATTLLLATATLFAQDSETDTANLSGTLVTDNGTYFPDALVFIYKAADSVMVKSELTDEKGFFQIARLQKTTYYLSVQFDNTILYTGKPFTLDADMVLDPITVAAPATSLDEVVITKTKQYIERQQGKLVLNVAQSISSAGASAFEIIEKAPGVSVDNNENISLRGRGGIAVHIDGRPTPMTGANLANYLKGIPAGSIEKIELVNNPSAKYDAAGSSIINVVLKKDKNMGTNGSATTAYAQGVYPKFNNSVNLNHHTKKTNLFGSYSNAFRQGFNDLKLLRRFYNGETFTGAYDQNNYSKIDLKTHNIRAGADFYPNKNHTIGFVASLGITNLKPNNNNSSLVYDGDGNYISRFKTTSRTWEDYANYALNLNHRFVMDTIGSTLVSDLDYARYNSSSNQNFDTRYYDTANVETRDPYLLFGDIDGALDIYAGKSDYKTTIAGKYGFEAGIKASYVVADNDQAFFDRSNGGNEPDPTKSNHFIYKENINAAYASTSGVIGKWNLQLGMRVENTNISGRQVANNTNFRNKYTQLFPNIFAGYALSDNHSLDFSYSRRITRAGYDQLNPFKFFLDPTTYREGYPFLKPQTTHSVDITHGYKGKFFTTLSLSRSTDNITQVIAPTEENAQLTAQTFRNLNTVDYYLLEFIIPLEITPWWNSTNNINGYYGSYSGTVGSTDIKNQGNFTANLNTVNTFKANENLTFELSGNYKAREVYAFMDVNAYWSLNTGFQYKFKNNSLLKFAFNDMFYTGITTADVTFNGYKEHFVVKRDSRQAVVSYTYNFGNGNQSRRRASAADDIKQRASSGNA